MELELSKDLVQKIKNREKLEGQDYTMALAKWNEIRKSFGIKPKLVDCCKGSQENMLKTLNNYYDSKLIEPEILRPYEKTQWALTEDGGTLNKVYDYEKLDRKFLYDLAIERELQIFKTIGKVKLIELHEKYDRLNTDSIN
jgi:hypothetical protein